MSEHSKESGRRKTDIVKEWVQELLGERAPVLVSELRCPKAECPSIETVIGILEKGGQRRWNIPRCLADISREDVERALRTESGNGAPAPLDHRVKAGIEP